MPVKKCHLPLPHPFKYITQEVCAKCPFSSWTDITSNPAAHGGSSWYESSASETSCPSGACVMGMGQTAPFLSPSCSRLSFPAPFLSASSSTFCCHTSGFEHGATSWIWSLAAVCCQRFPTEDKDGIQEARGNGGQAGKVHSRWRLRQNRISTGSLLFPSLHSAPWMFASSACLSHPLLYYFRKHRMPPPPPLPLNELFLDADFYSRLCYQHGSLGAHLNGQQKKVHRWKMTQTPQTIRIETFVSFAQWQMPTRRSWRIQSMQLLLLVWAGMFQGLWSANSSEWGLKKGEYGAWKCTLCHVVTTEGHIQSPGLSDETSQCL